MGSGSFNVSSGACAGLAFAFTGETLSGLTFAPGAVLGIDSNSAVDIDLSGAGLNRDIWLASARGAVYTGVLTPYDTTYRLAGGATAGGLPLVLARTNALTGARSVTLGDRGSSQAPGAVALAASNDYSGGTVLNATKLSTTGTKPSPTLIGRANGCFGPGPIVLNRNSAVSSSDPTLQLDTVQQTVPNDILATGTVNNAGAAIAANAPTRLTGNLTLHSAPNGTNVLNITGSSVLILDQAANGHAVTLSGIGRIAQNNATGLLDPIEAANLPANAGLYLPPASAMLVLSPAYGWTNLVAGRTWINSTSPTNYQWNGGSFAARGAPQTIDMTGNFGATAPTNWIDGMVNFRLGSTITNSDGSWYADAPIRFARDFNMTKAIGITVACQGPGLTNASNTGIVQELSGTASGSGILAFSAAGTATDGRVSELVLSGTNAWTGGYIADYQQLIRPCTGPGGLAICGSGGQELFVRFNAPGSLPRGNGGATAYLMAIGRTTGYNNRSGFLLAGSPDNALYTLPTGYKFMMGGAAVLVLGSTGTRATLSGSTVGCWRDNITNAITLDLLVRDVGGTFTLGTQQHSVQFMPVAAAPSGTQGLSTNPATPVVDCVATSVTRLVKCGPGTLVLTNVTYTRVDGVSDASTNFIWQLGRGVLGLYDGAVLETGLDGSNSLRNAMVLMSGGILGLASDYAPQLGAGYGQLNMSGAAGAGFAAYGARRTVTITPRSSDNLNWGQTTATANDFFMNGSAQLILNAPDADALIELTSAPTNRIDLRTGLKEIRVMDNPATNSDQAVIALRITGTGPLAKSGPGTLSLTATNCDYIGVTYVSNGTLCVNGTLLGNTPSNVYVAAGATLAGTGTIRRTVQVLAGGTLAAVDAYGTPASLSISNVVFQPGSTGSVMIANGVGSLLSVSNATLGGTLTLVFATPPTPGQAFDVLNWNTLTGTFAATNIVGVAPNYVNFGEFYTRGIVKFVTSVGTVFSIH